MTTEAKLRLRKWSGRIGVAVVVALAVMGMGYILFGGAPKAESSGTTFEARRGPLEITVVEGGSIEAKDSLEVKCEVQGATKILTIVEEGYVVTPEDVKAGKVLVELDSKELMDRKVEQELAYQNARAAYTQSKEAYEIQLNQNESDIKAAELEMKFARMDLEKYLGAELARQIIADLHLEEPPPLSEEEIQRALQDVEQSPPVATAPAPATGPSADDVSVEVVADAAVSAAPAVETRAAPASESPAATVPVPAPAPAAPTTPADGAQGAVDSGANIALASTFVPRASVDFSKYADPEKLGDGEAMQKLRTLEDASVLAQEEVAQARTQLEGTKRLFEKDFVTRDQKDKDELALQRTTIAEKSAATSQELFIRYEFPKEAERLLSTYEESLRKLERARKLALAKLAQSDAMLKSTQVQYELNKTRRDELTEQLAKCVIKAERPGLIVYGSGGGHMFWEGDQIKEGAMVRERQVIFTIPDTSLMALEVGVHESSVKRIKVGQRARIKVDAFPDKELTGTVDKIALLPDSENQWINPDLKVYPTKILIDGEQDWLKPGMSAEAEIIVDVIADVVQVPAQAVVSDKGEDVVFVDKVAGAERTVVETGEFNESFIEIKNGIEPGQRVLLLPPEGYHVTKPESLLQAVDMEGPAPAAPEVAAPPALENAA